MKNPILSLFLPFFFSWANASAQLPYTQKQYAVQAENDVLFGTATGFAGNETTLYLDIYKPVGDDNCQRPALLMIHGGGWIAGTRKDYDVAAICQELAARGYLTASLEYRLGMHVSNFYTPYAVCNDAINPFGINKCIYYADTMEIHRAVYRGMQDAKGAIRFLKNRSAEDSTDVNNFFVGGSSAGAFISLYTGLLDLPSEKPAFANAVADAPLPDSDLASCVPQPANRTRPDLGSIDGTLHLGQHDASVQGIAPFMGGIYHSNLMQPPGLPAIYLYHRTDDLVVTCSFGPIMQVYPYCITPNNLCQPLYPIPWASGSCAIADEIEGMGAAAPPFFNDIFNFGTINTLDCFDNPPGHSILDIPLRCTNLAGFFAPVIAANGNVPTSVCASTAPETATGRLNLRISPNPMKNGMLTINCENCPPGEVSVQLTDVTGRLLASQKLPTLPGNWDLSGHHLPAGLYFLVLPGIGVEKVLVE